jgi:hypothetical protein
LTWLTNDVASDCVTSPASLRSVLVSTWSEAAPVPATACEKPGGTTIAASSARSFTCCAAEASSATVRAVTIFRRSGLFRKPVNAVASAP